MHTSIINLKDLDMQGLAPLYKNMSTKMIFLVSDEEWESVSSSLSSIKNMGYNIESDTFYYIDKRIPWAHHVNISDDYMRQLSGFFSERLYFIVNDEVSEDVLDFIRDIYL